MKLYKIKDWNTTYENNRTRELQRLGWVPVPNKQDGDGFRAVIHHEDGLKIFGAWILMLQLASKSKTRGTLIRDNGLPHTERTIARMTGAQEGDIFIAMDYLASNDVGWLCYDHVDIPQEGATAPHPSGTTSHPTAMISHPVAKLAPEWNGTEQKGTEEKEPEPASPAQQQAKPSAASSNKGRARVEEPAGFTAFWNAWPSHFRKSDRPKCLAKWNSQKLEDRAAEIVAKVEAWSESDQWAKQDGEFIPAPMSWMNKGQYDAEAPKTSARPSSSGNDPDRSIKEMVGPYNPPADALAFALGINDDEEAEDAA